MNRFLEIVRREVAFETWAQLVVAALMIAAFFVLSTIAAHAGESPTAFFLHNSAPTENPGNYGTFPRRMAKNGVLGANVLASFYGAPGERLNSRTASGEPFRPLGFTAAHRTLPLGTRLRVAFADRSVVVRVNDRGPAAWTGRELDLSLGAARALGMARAGVARVSITVLE